MTKKIAIVTGAGSGIGRASAVALAAEGWHLVLAGRRVVQLAETADLIAGDSTRIVTDVTDEASVDALFNHVRDEWGRIDLLFNNAGTGTTGPLEDLPLDVWNRVIATNLTGAFHCTQCAFRLMKEQDPKGGRIINNGSISAHTPRPDSAPYTATKHALTGLTKSTSLDGRKYNIACGQIDIGNAHTPLTALMSDGVPQSDGRVVPEPTMDVDNVAKALVYMAGLDLSANVQFMTVMATHMPFVGRG